MFRMRKLDRGINLIDTAPVYGLGRSEEIVGKAPAEGGRRKRVYIAIHRDRNSRLGDSRRAGANSPVRRRRLIGQYLGHMRQRHRDGVVRCNGLASSPTGLGAQSAVGRVGITLGSTELSPGGLSPLPDITLRSQPSAVATGMSSSPCVLNGSSPTSMPSGGC